MVDKFLSTVVNQYRLPEWIISNCDPQLYGHFWDGSMSLLATTPTFNMALHPQTDQIAEVMNYTMEQLL